MLAPPQTNSSDSVVLALAAIKRHPEDISVLDSAFSALASVVRSDDNRVRPFAAAAHTLSRAQPLASRGRSAFLNAPLPRV